MQNITGRINPYVSIIGVVVNIVTALFVVVGILQQENILIIAVGVFLATILGVILGSSVRGAVAFPLLYLVWGAVVEIYAFFFCGALCSTYSHIYYSGLMFLPLLPSIVFFWPLFVSTLGAVGLYIAVPAALVANLYIFYLLGRLTEKYKTS